MRCKAPSWAIPTGADLGARFTHLVQVDMDTIEISNLNRQFLFRKRHVGKSKAETAAEAVRSFCPEAEIVTLQNNVKESMFDMAFMKSFDIVLNGLDNDEARRHVNRLCLAADMPLVESGTTGYKGQVHSGPLCGTAGEAEPGLNAP